MISVSSSTYIRNELDENKVYSIGTRMLVDKMKFSFFFDYGYELSMREFSMKRFKNRVSIHFQFFNF